MKRYRIWIKEGWAFFTIIGIVVLTIIYLSNFEHSEKTYKAFSSGAQLVGGVFILYSINDNIKILQNRTIGNMIKKWFWSFPYFKQSASVEVTGVSAISSAGIAIATSENNFKTLDQKVEFLLNEVKNIQKNMDHQFIKVNEKIMTETAKITESLEQKNNKIELIST